MPAETRKALTSKRRENKILLRVIETFFKARNAMKKDIGMNIGQTHVAKIAAGQARSPVMHRS
jgi:hypothetical protein